MTRRDAGACVSTFTFLALVRSLNRLRVTENNTIRTVTSAEHNALQVGRYTGEIHAVRKRCDDHAAKDRPRDVGTATAERRSAQYDRSDSLEGKPLTKGRLARTPNAPCK